MRLTPYERQVRREVETWQQGSESLVSQAINWAMQPVDWVVRQIISEDLMDQVDSAVSQSLSLLNDASKWTLDRQDVFAKAKSMGLDVDSLDELRECDLETLDKLARSYFSENAILAAVEGGGTGLGGVVFIAADIPLLFGINLRLIQQIGAAYGFPMDGPEYSPIALSIFNVAASGSREAKNNALREISVAGAAIAGDQGYRGRVSGTFHDQKRHLPREITKNIVGRKLAQTIPIAGAAIGAGVNYWFTLETAESAYMLFRALYVERKDRM